MVSLFPDLFDFAIFGVTLLRISAGGFLLVYGIRFIQLTHDAKKDASRSQRVVSMTFAILQCVVGALLVIGLFTQGAAFLGALVSLTVYEVGRIRSVPTSIYHIHLLLFVVCVALIFLGPGAFAIDLPV